jgi:hypothetical protein
MLGRSLVEYLYAEENPEVTKKSGKSGILRESVGQ